MGTGRIWYIATAVLSYVCVWCGVRQAQSTINNRNLIGQDPKIIIGELHVKGGEGEGGREER